MPVRLYGPAFNLADSAITIGALLVILELLGAGQHPNREHVRPACLAHFLAVSKDIPHGISGLPVIRRVIASADDAGQRLDLIYAHKVEAARIW